MCLGTVVPRLLFTSLSGRHTICARRILVRTHPTSLYLLNYQDDIPYALDEYWSERIQLAI